MSVGRGSSRARVLGRLLAEGLWGPLGAGAAGVKLRWRPDSGEQEEGVQHGAECLQSWAGSEVFPTIPWEAALWGGELPVAGRIQADMGDGFAVRGSVLGERLDRTRSP